MNKTKKSFTRWQAETLLKRLREPRRFIQVVAGPRQVGKSTMVKQVIGQLQSPVRYASADEPTLKGPEWIAQQWSAARLDCLVGLSGSFNPALPIFSIVVLR